MSIHPDLITRAQAGDPAARDALIRHSRPLLSYLGLRLSGRTPPDLIQEGIVALLANLPGYDPSKGATFATYIYPHVRGAMLAYLRREWTYRNHWQGDVPESLTAEPHAEHETAPPELPLDCLDAQERDVIERLYGFRGPPESTADVARTLGLGIRRVQQIHATALERLKALCAPEE